MGTAAKPIEDMTVPELLKAMKDGSRSWSLREILAAINRLNQAKATAQAQEQNARQREREQRQRLEQQARDAHIQRVTSMELPMDWENAFAGDVRAQGVHTDSIPDALILSLTTLGRVDIPYMASITGADCKTVITTLRGAIFQNPETWEECFYQGWETAEEYLSGNLMRKYRAARKANRTYQGYFAMNVEALRQVMPPAVASEDIYITMGSPWVPADIIDQFIIHLFGEDTRYRGDPRKLKELFATRHDPLTGTWEIPCKDRYRQDFGTTAVYGTARMPALTILEKALNMKAASVTKKVPAPGTVSGEKRVIDQEQTLLALEKQNKLVEAFRSWVWKDEQRKQRLLDIFESQFSCVRQRRFSGSFLDFPTMSHAVELYPYQKDAVARILFTPNTLLAHDVGAGKTYVMIASAMESVRMGLSSKNMFVVPNNLVGQWKDAFALMYPQAKVLCVTPGSFTPAKRQAVLEKIRDESWDGIVIAYSCFEQIPLSKSFYETQLLEEQTRIQALTSHRSSSTAQLARKQETVKKALFELATTVEAMAAGVYFDQLGITRLYVDEAHNFKNVPLETKTSRVLGIRSGGSKKCQDMLDKVRLVQRSNQGGGVVLATGTPITNSVTDVYVMQKFLQDGELALLDLQSFDSWIGMFAQQTTEFEIDVDTSSYRLATRFSQFHNLPELTGLLSSIADFHGMEGTAGIPRMEGYRDVRLRKTPELGDYLSQISQRAEQVRAGAVSRVDDNMLKITTDGRKAALDIRLVEQGAVFSIQSKVMQCAENVARIYHATAQSRSTQLIFCDTSTPKAGFNIYDEMKRLLVSLDVEPREIAFIHHAQTESQRSALFAQMRRGQVRVLLGSTFKLGLGVNVQDKLIALHHLDVPWRPADMTQREGRILRQGNENSTVQIFRYITEGSFDAYSWQLLETKQRFICDLLSGSLSQRSGSDIEDTVLSYAEVKALAVGHPLVKERVEVSNELARLRTLQRKLVESRLQWEQELLENPQQQAAQEALIHQCRQDILVLSSLAPLPPQDAARLRKDLRAQLHRALQDNILRRQETPLAVYRGFSIVLPANMTADRPCLYLQCHGKYFLEMGDAEVGHLVRIDNFLNDLAGHLEKLRQALQRLRSRHDQLRRELAKADSYAEPIAACLDKLKRIDKLLGVDKL